MAMLAPYTNAMRLGQGFNSYTQQICLDKAVVIPSHQDTPPTELARLALDSAFTPETGSPADVHNLELEDGSARRVVKRVHNGQSQIVTYTAKFIDKLSDITGSCDGNLCYLHKLIYQNPSMCRLPSASRQRLLVGLSRGTTWTQISSNPAILISRSK
jgi:hypothetical protein